MVVKAKKAGRDYALKLYSDDYLKQGGHTSCCAVDLFRRETEILRSVRHPRIPGWIDSFGCEDMYCLVQDYVSGNTLAELINQGREFSEEQIKQIVLELLQILSFLHRSADGRPAVVHRDLRLSNLLLLDDMVYLIDFGLACRIENAADEVFLRKRIELKSHDAVSPSYAKMREDLSIQSDLFGVGVITVDLFTNSVVSGAPDAWEQQIPVSGLFKAFVRRLLGAEGTFASCTEAADNLLKL